MLDLEFLEPRDLLNTYTPDWWREVVCQNSPETTSSLATVALTQGWVTFGQPLPSGVAYGDSLRVGNLPTQTDLKNRWPDGSLKYAVVTAYVPQGGTYTLTAGESQPGSMTPTQPPVSVWFYMHDDWYYAYPENFDWSDRWLSGALVTEARQVATVHHWTTGNVYPNLRVVFDVRAYADGQSRVDFAVENTLDLASAGMESYQFWVVDGDTAPVYHDIPQHPYLTRWRGVYRAAVQESQVTPDFEPAYAANALPRYWEGVQNRVYAPVGHDFEPLGRGSLHPDMPAHGGREELAPYPDWAARYLVHKDATQKRFVLTHGDLAGSWPIHVRNLDGSFVDIDRRPRYWHDIPLWREVDRPAGDLSAVGPLMPDNAHQPSLAYIPYLMTGDRYYADEMAFWANYTMLATIPGIRGGNGSEGLLWSNETRGFAWGLRSLTDAAAYLPDNYPLKSYFVDKLDNNLRWLDGLEAGPLGVAWHRSPFDDGSNPYFDPENRHVWQSASQNNVLAWAVDHANKQGFAGGATFQRSLAAFNVALLSDPATRDGAAPYYTPIGDRMPPGSPNIVWYTDYRQTYQGPVQYAGYYGADARLMVLLGLDLGLPGAQAAFDYLDPQLTVEPFMEFVPDLALRAGWAVVFRQD